MTGMGIVIFVVCAIGVVSIASWVVKAVTKLFKAKSQKKYIRVGHERKLTCYDNVPQYKGRTWLGGLPVYADVVMPDKHNYATIIYMDHWFKQYVYDVMVSWRGVCDGIKEDGWLKTSLMLLFFPVMLAFGGVSIIKIVIGIAILIAILYLWYIPSGMPMIRRSAENAKDFTPDTWRKIYKEVAESQEREDEMVRALRRSGIRRL